MNRGTRVEVIQLRERLEHEYENAAAVAANQTELDNLLDAVLDEVLGGTRHDERVVVPIDLYATRYRLVNWLKDLRCESGDEAIVELLAAWDV